MECARCGRPGTKDLSTLGSLSFNNDMKLFVDSSTGKGYITISTLATEVAKSAEIRLDIDLVGVLADRPATAAKGFAFYAEDTGDLHIMGPDNVWRSPAHIRGPKGRSRRPGGSWSRCR